MKFALLPGILPFMQWDQQTVRAGSIETQPDIPAPSASPGNLELFLLIGQSNMAGRAKVETEDTIADPRIWILDASGRWVSKGEPVHFDKPKWVGMGPGFSFAKAMAGASPGKTIGLIPCAAGNTPLDRWVKGGDLYEAAVLRALIAKQSGRLRAILWHHGESDSGAEASTLSYGDKLAHMVVDLRVDLQAGAIPFLAGLLGDFLVSRTDERFPCAEAVNTGIRTLPGRVPNAFIVSSAGLGHRGDNVHFDSQAARELGNRYAAVLLAAHTEEP